MKKITTIGWLSVLLAGTCSGAYAESSSMQPVQKPITIMLGAFFPHDGDVKNGAGSTFFTAGADYAFEKTATASPLLPLVYVDYAGNTKKGDTATSVGVGVGFRAYGDRATNTTAAPYFGAGVGAYFLHLTSSANGTFNNTVLGGKVYAGVELNQGPFIQASYQYTGTNDGDRLDGVSVDIGSRF